MNMNPEKVWQFDFRVNPEKYSITKKMSNFYRIFINFHHKKTPIVFALQGTNGGESLGIFVGKLENSEIKEVTYIENFFNGDFIDIEFFKGRFYILDSAMRLKVVKLPLVGY